MSQTTPPKNHGHCNSCRQVQPYSNQTCYFCSSPLPWATPVVTPIVPPTLPRVPPQTFPSQVAPPNNARRILIWAVAAVFGGITSIALFVIVGLSILGNRVKNDMDMAAQNTAMAQNGVSFRASTVRSECGAMNSEECTWMKNLVTAIAPFSEPEPLFETDSEKIARWESLVSEIKTNMDSPKLRMPPARCLYAKTQIGLGMDEMDFGVRLAKDAVRQSNPSLLDEGAAHMRKAGNFFRIAQSAFDQLAEPPAH